MSELLSVIRLNLRGANALRHRIQAPIRPERRPACELPAAPRRQLAGYDRLGRGKQELGAPVTGCAADGTAQRRCDYTRDNRRPSRSSGAVMTERDPNKN